MYTGVAPFLPQLKNDGQVALAVVGGKRPARPMAMEDQVWTFTQSCWDGVAVRRPSMEDVVAKVKLWFTFVIHLISLPFKSQSFNHNNQ